MSRSKKKTPITGITYSKSNKRFKQNEHRRERRAVNILLHTGKEIMPPLKKYGNEWASPRDGKTYFGDMKCGIRTYSSYVTYELLEKDREQNIEYYKQEMRK